MEENACHPERSEGSADCKWEILRAIALRMTASCDTRIDLLRDCFHRLASFNPPVNTLRVDVGVGIAIFEGDAGAFV